MQYTRNMDQNELDYLQRQMALGRQRLRRYVINPENNPYPKRNIYIKTKRYLDSFLAGNYDQKRWIIIPGLRGTGKTTILAQTYYELSYQYGDSINLLYFSLNEAVDTIGATISSILYEYERLLGESFEVVSKPTIMLIDEVQSDPKWAPVLKALNERTSKVFLICSGSSAVHLQDDADITGRRAVIERLYPMNFSEFEMVHYHTYPTKGLKNKLKNGLYGSADAESCYNYLLSLKPEVDRYWAKIDRRHWQQYINTGSLPFALTERTVADIYDAVLSSIDKVITKDIQQLGRFTPETIPVVKRLLYVLAESDVISNHKLSAVLGITPITIANILDVLVKAELLIRVYPHGSHITAAKKASKYLFMSSVVRAALYHLAGSASTSATQEGRLLEDVAGLHYYRNFEASGTGQIEYDSAEGGADLILKTSQARIAIEIGRGQKTPRQTLTTMKRISCKYGLVISESQLSISADKTVVMVPWDFFALT